MDSRRARAEDRLKEPIYPITKEQAILQLIGVLTEKDQTAQTLLEFIQHTPNHNDPHVQETRVLELSIGLIDLGARLILISPLSSEIRSLLYAVVSAISIMEYDKVVTASDIAIRALRMMQAALLQDNTLWTQQFDNQEDGRRHSAEMLTLAQRLKTIPVRSD